MYNKINYISAVLVTLLLGLSSCSEKFQEAGGGEEPQVQKGNDILSLSLEGFSATKLQLQSNGDDYRQVWTEGDKISVIGTSGKTDLTLYDGSGTVSGTFSGDLSGVGDKPYYIVFPCEEEAGMTDNSVHFTIPQVKIGAVDDVAPGSMPCVARIGSDGNTEGMKNVMGLLRLTLSSSSSVQVSKMTLHDLGGNMLWGECDVPVENGTLDYDNIALTGGDNSISLVWDENNPVEISSAKSFFFPVPPGALDRGFSVVIYDATGKAYTFIQKVTNPVAVPRASSVNISSSALTEKSEAGDPKARGYYKSIFVDAGIGLNKYYTYSPDNDIPAIASLGLTDDCEFFVSYTNENPTDEDRAIQNELFVGSENDENGVLLYPDNSPRFRMIYTNGGSSVDHGVSLGEDGRDRVHTFNANGGSFVGSCAGSFLAATEVDGKNRYSGNDDPEYPNFSYGLFPGRLYHTFNFYVDGNRNKSNLSGTNYYIDFSVLKSFGTLEAGNVIHKVRHYGGSFLPDNQENSVEEKTERLLSYNDNDFSSYIFAANWGTYNGNYLNGETSTWAYKGSDESGRVVCTGSHPEHKSNSAPDGAEDEEYQKLTASMFTYAMEGTGDPRVKTPDLVLDDVREMDKSTGDNQPDYTKIGDRQYHHFKFSLSQPVKNVVLYLTSEYDSNSGIDLYLSLRKGDLAWLSDADYTVCTKGGNKVLNIKELPAGEWYVGVYCATRVKAERKGDDANKMTRPYYFKYVEDGDKATIDAIAGIPYRISIGNSNAVFDYPSASLNDDWTLND